jgi:hypothetical protein
MTAPTHGSRRQEWRQLTPAESGLLTWFLNGTDAGRQYLGQVSTVRVVGSCSCGCPTIDFAAPHETTAAEGASTIVADGYGLLPEGGKVGVIVHVRDAWISELEIYSMDAKRPCGLPSLDSCEVY